jgi:hypothetical protein
MNNNVYLYKINNVFRKIKSFEKVWLSILLMSIDSYVLPVPFATIE